MNLTDAAALALSCLAVAISVCAVYAVRPSRKKPVSLQQWVVPKDNGALMRDARRLREAQAAGTIHIHGDSITPGMTDEQIDQMVQRAGRHL